MYDPGIKMMTICLGAEYFDTADFRWTASVTPEDRKVSLNIPIKLTA
jgi:hypothetical protein